MRCRRLAVLVSTACAVTLTGAVAQHALAKPAITGGGSSFAALEIDQWRAEVARNPFGLTINYSATGSSQGRQQFITGNWDWGASDIPFLDSEIPSLNANRPDYAYVPISAGGLGFMYNVQDLNSGNRVTDLHLTRRAVCRMFTELNMMWNDPEIQTYNPAVALPAEPVRPIVRQDGSGTSYVLSEFCIAAAGDVWGAFIQTAANTSVETEPAFRNGGPTSNWPRLSNFGTGVGADGVAAVVADPNNGRNTITYNEAGYAKVWDFPNAYVANTAGNWLLPEPHNVSVALGYATPTVDANGRPGTFALDYVTSNPDAYFPSTYSYAIVPTADFDAAKGDVLARFLCYAVSYGQRADLTDRLEYAQLSVPLIEIALTSIQQIPGAPDLDDCVVVPGGAPATTTTVAGTTTTTQPPTGGQATTTTVPRTGATTTVPVGSGSTTTTTTPGGGGENNGGNGQSSGNGGQNSGNGPNSNGNGGSSGGNSNTGGATATTAPCIPATTTTVAASGAVATTTTTTTTSTSSSATTTTTAGPTTSSTTLPPCDPNAPVGGEVVGDVADGGGLCTDPVTGGPVDDAALCATFGEVVTPGVVDPATGEVPAPVDGVVAPAVPTVAPVNPTVLDSSGGPKGSEIAWVLIQGSALCGLGVGVAGLRKRVAL